ncbi:MAG: hypothetical protein FWD57_12615 [Polyangiaceae bacterium]|nr:hypothetical protein [Polyangiaceae bacterium]
MVRCFFLLVSTWWSIRFSAADSRSEFGRVAGHFDEDASMMGGTHPQAAIHNELIERQGMRASNRAAGVFPALVFGYLVSGYQNWQHQI